MIGEGQIVTPRSGWVLSLITVLLWSVLALTSHGQAGQISILNQFPGYHLLTLQERDPTVKAFLDQHFPKSNPSVIRADFNGDGSPDYALLLKDDKTGAAKLVVLLCSGNSQCKTVYEADETAVASIVYLRPVKPGSQVSETEAGPANTPPVKLHSTGIEVNYFEKGAVVLHWNPKSQKFEEVETED